MKMLNKSIIVLLLSLFIASCSKDDSPAVANFDKNVNQNLFEGLEIGNSKFILPQSNVDIHVEFDYKGSTTNVTKILFDIIPFKVPNIKEGQVAWSLKNHLVPIKRYKGQRNPHIHYHVYFDENNKRNPKLKPAEGIYKFRITVEHEDGSKSFITKKFNITQIFKNLKIGDNNTIAYGSDKLVTEFQYNSGNNSVEEVSYQFWFKEWRKGKKVEVGKWTNIIEVLSKVLYEGAKNPIINYDFKLIPNLPKGDHWLNLLVKVKGEKEAVKLSIPIKVK